MAGLTLTVLGCSGSYPGRDRACSGYLVRGGGVSIWLDAGSGTMSHLQRHVRLEDIDAVVLSHEHPDHWRDLEGFVIACRYGLGREGVPVYGPAGIPPLAYNELAPNLAWTTVADGDEASVGGVQFRFSRTDHMVETLAMRIEFDGRVLVYSADTGPEWSMASFGPGIDLALCEATLRRDQEGSVQHLSGHQAGVMAREAGAARLLLTHLWPTADPEQIRREGVEGFRGPVELAVENEEYRV